MGEVRKAQGKVVEQNNNKMDLPLLNKPHNHSL
jgi:hypothetical protein